MADTGFGRARAAAFFFEEVKPEADATSQLLSLSDSVRHGELFLVLEIPSEALRANRRSEAGAGALLQQFDREWIKPFSCCRMP